MLGNFFMLLLLSADFYQDCLFQKFPSGILSEYQTFWTQIMTDVLSVLIWVQTVCKGYQKTTNVVVSKEKVNYNLNANSMSPDQTAPKEAFNLCFDALRPSQQFLSHVKMIPCIPGMNQY